MQKRILMLAFAGSLMLRTTEPEDRKSNCSIPRCMAVGLGVGILTGFLGVGGGFLIVPALILSAGLATRLAGGTSLAVIALNSTAGLLGQLRYTRLDWGLLARFLFFAVIGILAGIGVAHRMNGKVMRRVFAATLIVIAVVVGGLNIRP